MDLEAEAGAAVDAETASSAAPTAPDPCPSATQLQFYKFHEIHGSRISLINSNRSAIRNQAKTDFNNGLVFSSEPLETNRIFQVRLDKKVGLWSGSIEIGITCIEPSSTFLAGASEDSENVTGAGAAGGASGLVPVPQNAVELRSGTWLMSSSTVLKDGETFVENYGFDLEQIEEGDTVGLMRTIQGQLVFFINGISQGVAASFVPSKVYALVNLYGKCAQVSLVDVEASTQSSNTGDMIPVDLSPTSSNENLNSNSFLDNNNESDKLKFHQNCGPLVKLSNNFKVAERRRPMEEFNNAVVLTHRPLRDNELFQVRIDLLIQKWSGSIEFGLTTHNPETFEFPHTMTIMRNGTVIMSGNGILHDGRAANSPYSHFNLDQLQEGDRIGVMKSRTGEVHYFVNGIDTFSVMTGLTKPTWGAINLYGMAAKVTIVDRNEREEHNLRVNARPNEYPSNNLTAGADALLFHQTCGFHAAVINNGRTAHRPNARDDFNHGVVLTNRILRPNELFEVRLDRLVTKWAGSIEIGVTIHLPTELDYPCTMTNVRSGTWMMTGSGIMLNGSSILEDYGQSLDRLQVGDRVGVLRKESGDLHFYVNSVDQGCAANEVPENVYGVIDLYGQAAQATIANSCSVTEQPLIPITDKNILIDNSLGSISNEPCFPMNFEGIFDSNDLRFHTLCGKNAKVSNNGLTASRPNSLGEFNAAIVITNRALKDNELFEVIIERMVDRWSGNIEAGVTTIRPEDLVFPNTMTDIDYDTWMLSGSSLMTGGTTITNRYNCNLDTLTCGSRVGIMRKDDGSLHYFINGQDMGPATFDIPQNVYAVVDLYGQCSQVRITKVGDISLLSSQLAESLSLPIANESSHRFSNASGKNILLKNNNTVASRVRHYNHGLLFSSAPLEADEIFEVRIVDIKAKWAGSINIGVTELGINDDYPPNQLPHCIGSLCADTWFVTGTQVRKNNVLLKENYCVNLCRLSVGDRLGISISSAGCLKICINGEDMGVAAYNVPKKLHAVVDLYGTVETVCITSTLTLKSVVSPVEVSPNSSGSEKSTEIKATLDHFSFHEKHGKHIELSEDRKKAVRVEGFNNGIVLSSFELQKEVLFQIRIGRLNMAFQNSLMVGVTECPVNDITFPWSAIQMWRSTCIIYGDIVIQNGCKMKCGYGTNLNNLREGQLVGVLVDADENMHLYVDGVDQGVAAKNVGSKVRALLDVYGQCVEIEIQQSTGTKSEKEASNIECQSEQLLGENEPDLNCPHLNACLEFKKSLFLPEPYFVQTEPILCYCKSCHFSRKEKLILEQGDPSTKYALPIGWVRFPVNFSLEAFPCSGDPMMTSSTSSLNNVLTTWNVAYHGLKIPHIRQCMDAGCLYNPESENGPFPSGLPLRSRRSNKEKNEKADGKELIFSPSIDYATIPEFSPTYHFTNPTTNEIVTTQVAFQVLVQPGSYKTGAPSYPLPSGSLICSKPNNSTNHLNPEELEWGTKEEGSAHVIALLIRVVDKQGDV